MRRAATKYKQVPYPSCSLVVGKYVRTVPTEGKNQPRSFAGLQHRGRSKKHKMATFIDDQHSSKRLRSDDGHAITVFHPYQSHQDEVDIRTSSLAEPTMRLLGHKGSIYSLAFDPNGECLCSGSFDMTCLLWNASGRCDNFNVLVGHKNAILDVKWSSDSEHIVTASADKTLGWYDACTGDRIKRFMGHSKVVNAVDTTRGEGTSPTLVVSASDDATVRLWDARVRGHVMQLTHKYQVTSVAFSLDAHTVYTGGIDNVITAFDIRSDKAMSSSANNHKQRGNTEATEGEQIMTMKGHTDTITCLSVSPDGTQLLSNSMDGSIRSWDIRPFVTGNIRRRKTFLGGTHNAEKGLLNCSWSADGTMISGGSADRIVHVWDESSAEELYYLPGHTGCVNSVIFHPKEYLIASGSSDKTVYIGELAH